MQSNAQLLPKTTFPYLFQWHNPAFSVALTPVLSTRLFCGQVQCARLTKLQLFLLAQFPVSSGISEHGAAPEWEQELPFAVIPEHF